MNASIDRMWGPLERARRGVLLALLRRRQPRGVIVGIIALVVVLLGGCWSPEVTRGVSLSLALLAYFSAHSGLQPAAAAR